MIVATVCGGAEGVWDEYERATALALSVMGPGDSLIRLATNDAGVIHPEPLHHWCTLHHEKLERWRKARREAGLNDPVTWGVAPREPIDRVQRVWKGGSSGLLAVDVALHRVEADAVILCGIPMDDRRNEFSGKDWGQWTRYWPDWKKARSELVGRVTSWTGRTREMLGEPTVEWLEGRTDVARGAGSDAA